MPVVVGELLHVVLWIIGHGALPHVPVEIGGGWRRELADFFTRVVIGATGKARLADDSAVQCSDGFLHPGAALIAHLHELAGFLHGGDERFRFARVLAAGLFDIDVLAGLQRQDGHGRVPEVRRGDENGIDRFVFEDLAEVLHALAGRGLLVGHHLQPFVETTRVRLREVGDLHIRQCEQRLHMPHATTERDDGDFHFVRGFVRSSEFRQGGKRGPEADGGSIGEKGATVHGRLRNRGRGAASIAANVASFDAFRLCMGGGWIMMAVLSK